ncbi:MAG: extracellular solute-binding protein [Anaerolineales bacterium]|nr:extracellular solute-binding protein [Anaerolineales bacterium]
MRVFRSEGRRRHIWRLENLAGLTLVLLLLLSGCGGALVTPRELTGTAQAAAPADPTQTPERLTIETPTPIPAEAIAGGAEPELADNPTVTIWVNEISEEHRQALANIAADYNDETGIQVSVMHVSPALLPELVQTAVLSNTLPDLIIHPMEYTMGWAEQGILDPAAAAEAIGVLGEATFAPEPLALMQLNGQPAAIPSDGWTRLIIYRQDWFDEQGLNRPDSFDHIMTASEAIYDAENGISGLVVPTESSLFSTQQTFEQFAVANGCDLVDEKGEVLLLHPACLDTLDYYRELINLYSPSDVQTDISALNSYLAGRTSLIIVPSSVLPQLAGLDPLFPPRCPECSTNDYLVGVSGIATDITGRSEFARSASFSELTYLGITRTAQKDLAISFAEYWFETAYEQWLAVDSERKVPLRLGTAAEPERYFAAWGSQPLDAAGTTLLDIYGPETIAQVRDGVVTANRWAFRQGQGALMTDIYEELTLSILLQELLSGYFTSSYAIIDAYQRVTDLIPGYQYYPEPVEEESG